MKKVFKYSEYNTNEEFLGGLINFFKNLFKKMAAQIQKLNEQILELQNQANAAANQLSAIDQKYNDQFIDIDTKVNAISTAKEQVISSIVDIESGIKNNLK